MADNKMTKKEIFTAMREVVKEYDYMVAFIDHEIELLNKKRGTKKPTATQIQNEGIKQGIFNYLSAVDDAKTVSEVMTECPECAEIEGFSNQRATHLLNAMVDAGTLTKTYVKKKAYFAVNKEGGAETV